MKLTIHCSQQFTTVIPCWQQLWCNRNA